MKRVILIGVLFLAVLATFSLRFQPTGLVTEKEIDISEDRIFLYETTKYPTSVEIIEAGKKDLGIVVDTHNLNFGRIPQDGSHIKRSIKVVNKMRSPVKVKLAAQGNIADMIEFEENNFILQGYEEKDVNIFLRPSLSVDTGVYSGEIDLVIIRPKSDIFSFLLGVV